MVIYALFPGELLVLAVGHYASLVTGESGCKC